MVSVPRCAYPCNCRTMLEMLFKLMKLRTIPGADTTTTDLFPAWPWTPRPTSGQRQFMHQPHAAPMLLVSRGDQLLRGVTCGIVNILTSSLLHYQDVVGLRDEVGGARHMQGLEVCGRRPVVPKPSVIYTSVPVFAVVGTMKYHGESLDMIYSFGTLIGWDAGTSKARRSVNRMGPSVPKASSTRANSQ